MDVWFIVQTNPNCERKAAREMRRRGFGVHIPRLTVLRVHHRTKKPILKRRPLMTGYLFMRFKGPESWYDLRKCQGVKGVLYVDEHPFRMDQADVVAIIRAQRYFRYDDQNTRAVRTQMRFGGMGVGKARHKAAMARFRVGMNVAAPMSGAERMIARIVAITKKGTVRAVVRGSGRDIPVEFTDIEAIEPVDDEKDAA